MSATGPGWASPDSVRSAMEAEFHEWRQNLPVMSISTGGAFPVRHRVAPDPRYPGGLPQGWTVHAVMSEFVGENDLCVVRRAGGGVALLRRESDLNRIVTLVQSAPTLVELDSFLFERYPPERDAEREWGAVIRDWVRGVIISLYDRTDPDEAAEQTLLALSGRIRTPPRAAF